MLRLATQLRLRLLGLVAVTFLAAVFVLWKGETIRARRDVELLLRVNYRDVTTGFSDRADYQLSMTARDIAERLGTSGKLAAEDVAALCEEEEVQEIYDIGTNGVVAGGSRLVGVKVHGEQWSEFLALLEPGAPETMSQPDRPRTSDGKVFKYAAARFPDGSGYIEVGWSEERFLKYLRQRAYGYTRSWHIDERGWIAFADRNGILTSHADMSLAGRSVRDALGLDPAAIPRGDIFRAEILGEEMFCFAGPVRDGYWVLLADPASDVFASRNRFMPQMSAVQLAVFAALFAFVSEMLRRRVAGSVREIGDALRRIAGGDLAGKADVRSSLEFSELSDNINATVDALRSAAEERIRRVEADLELGRTIQQATLPAEFPDEECWRLDASMEAAREVGGDFYDFFPLGETHRAFLVADVSGKGITGALYMMNAKTLVKDALLADPARDPAAALARVNAELCANNPAEMFVTAWIGVLDLETGRAAFANAGHNPPLRLRAGEAPEWLRERSGVPLGCFGNAAYRLRETVLAPGDALFLYTDGVTEAADASNAFFGEDRLVSAVASAPSRDPRALAATVRAAVSAFVGAAPRADDLTILAVQYLGPPERHLKTFPCDATATAASAAYLEEILDGADCPPRPKAQLLVALDEIVSNAVRCSGASGIAVEVRFARDPRGAAVSVSDDGKPFDPLSVPPPDTTLSADERPIGGLGLLLVRETMDAVAYRRAHGCNIFTFRKNFA
jgi:serine phosphatase RsbU (regulator of sigma subunit)/anti-sigma regulatory factor (Ser/Thr protein kinase)